MEFTVESKKMQEALKLAASITQGPEHVNLETDGKKLYVVATGNHNVIRVFVDADTKKKGKVTVNSYTITNIVKGRKELSFSLDDSEMKFSSKNYRGSFVVPPFEEITFSNEEGEGEQLKLGEKTQSKLMDIVRAVSLNNVFTDSLMYLFLTMDKAGIRACCCDQTHIAYFKGEGIESKKSKSIALPIKVFEQISALAKGVPYSLAVSDNAIYVRSEAFELSMPMVQSDDAINLEIAEGFIKALPKIGNITFSVPRNQLITALNNCLSIYEENSGLEIKKGKNGVMLELRTSYGQVQEKLKTKNLKWKGDSVKCDPKLLLDTIQAVPQGIKEIEVNLVGEKAIFFRVKHNKAKLVYSCTVL